MKWPVAADSLISPPFAGAADVMNASPRLAPDLPVPDCLAQLDDPVCDTYVTTETCAAGDFTFSGVMRRRCASCDDPTTVCTYAWILPTFNYTSDKFSIKTSTAGVWTGAASQITPNLSARYDLSSGGVQRVGDILACACTPFTIEGDPNNKPRKLVNSSFVVRHYELDLSSDGCALVKFDGNGDVSVSNSCRCEDGVVCSSPRAVPTYPDECGDGLCDPNAGETYEVCPVDCPYDPSVCGNNVCELDEDFENCALDCVAGVP
jgi:hypothetical protein